MSDCRFGVSPVNYPDPDPDKVRLIPKQIYGLVSSLFNVLICTEINDILLIRFMFYEILHLCTEAGSMQDK